MTQQPESARVAFLATDGVEEVELTRPWRDLQDAGAEPVLVSLEDGSIQAFHHLDKAGEFPVDQTVSDACVDDFAALVLPGGVANPDALRMEERAVDFVREFVAAGKPVAAICHAAWLLVEADVVRGRTVTSYPSVRTDIVNAGGHWIDEQVVEDGPLITSRRPADLDAFCKRILDRVVSS